jgi:hypothetical protein
LRCGSSFIVFGIMHYCTCVLGMIPNPTEEFPEHHAA